MTTLTWPAVNGKVFADEPPDEIRSLLEDLVDADLDHYLDRRAYSRSPTAANSRRIAESAHQLDAATKRAERALDDHFPFRPDAFWPIRGKLVGFSSVSKYGMRLRITAAWCDPRKRRTR